MIRVGPRGFALLVEELSSLVPERFDFPKTSTVVADWPLTDRDARIELGPVPQAIALHGVDVVMLEGGIVRLRALVDVAVEGPATLYNALAGLGSERCEIRLRLSQVRAEADFQLRDAGGQIRAELVRVDATSRESQRTVSISGCTVGDLYTRLSETLGIQSDVGTKAWLETFARERVPPLIEGALAGQSIRGQVGTGPLSYTVQLSQAQSDASGLVLRADVAVDPRSQGFASCLAVSAPPLAPSCEKPAAPPAATDAMYGASFSAGLVNRALHATWRAGLLCIDSNRLDLPEIAASVEKLAASLGLPAGSRVVFRISPKFPPYVSFTQRDGARLHFDELDLELQLAISDGRSGSLRLLASFSVAASPRVDPATNSLGLDLEAVGVEKISLGHVDQAQAAIQLDPARLQHFISDVVVPLLRRQLEQSQLSPSVVQAGAYYAVLQHIFVADDYVSLQVDAIKPPDAPDALPPDTRLIDGPTGLVGPRLLPLKVAGVDNVTPPALLRFQASVDGGPWSAPRFGGLVEVVTHGGRHQIAVAAVDLRGNVDPTPFALAVEVDDISPEVQITRRPEELIDSQTIDVGFAARDDRSAPAALSFSAELLRISDDGGTLEVVERQELPAGTSSARLRARGNGLFRVRITASDQAGNVGSAEVGVVVEGGGCHVVTTSRSSAPIWPILLVVSFALPLGVRRGVRKGQRPPRAARAASSP